MTLLLGNNGDLTMHYAFVRRGEAWAEDPDLSEAVAGVADGLEAALGWYRDSVAAVDADPALTALGRRAAKDGLVRQLAARLAPTKKAVEKLQERLALRESILKPEHRHRLFDDLTAAEAAALEAEVRGKLAGMVPEAATRAYLEFCDQNDVIGVRAVERVGASLRPVPADVLAEGAERHAAACCPEGYRELQMWRAAVGSVTADLNRGVRQLSADLADAARSEEGVA